MKKYLLLLILSLLIFQSQVQSQRPARNSVEIRLGITAIYGDIGNPIVPDEPIRVKVNGLSPGIG